jgi:hypothetical protein
MWPLMVRTSLRRQPVRRERRMARSRRPGRDDRSRNDSARQTTFVAALALWWGAALATQYVAAQLGSRHRLGVWLYRVPATSHFSIRVAMGATAAVAVVALISRSWRWAAVPLTLLTASLYAALVDAIYAPAAVWRWYMAFGALPADRSAFRLALAIVAATVVLMTVAEPRVQRAVGQALANLRQPALVRASTWPGHAALPVPMRIPVWRMERAKQPPAVGAEEPQSPARDPDASTIPDSVASLEEAPS